MVLADIEARGYADLCWKVKFAEMPPSDMKRPRLVKQEKNAKLKKLVADMSLFKAFCSALL
jgi:hypothetical protein